MKVKIEIYRGFEMLFDTEKENFYCVSDELDWQTTKNSYSSAKRSIDDYIKNNVDFKPVWVERLDDYYTDKKKIKLVGIRKDKRFVYEDKDGNKQQLSDYDERNFFIVNPNNDSIFEELKLLRNDKEDIDKKINETKNKLIMVGLQTIKSRYTV